MHKSRMQLVRLLHKLPIIPIEAIEYDELHAVEVGHQENRPTLDSI
jgi:hypothetical protein